MSANLKRMSLEEAINHANVKAEDQEREARVITSEVLRIDHLQCAADHRQLAAWLTELKNRREKESSEDTISRQDAIDCVRWGDSVTNVIDRVNALPSAEPHYTGCSGCVHYDQQQTALICYDCKRCYKDLYEEEW